MDYFVVIDDAERETRVRLSILPSVHGSLSFTTFIRVALDRVLVLSLVARKG